MGRDNDATVDERVLAGMSGGEKLKALLRQKHGTISRAAATLGIEETELYHMLSGAREYPQHRDAVAKDLDLDRETVDSTLESTPTEAVA